MYISVTEEKETVVERMKVVEGRDDSTIYQYNKQAPI
jgi:hypothetical protein